MDRRSFVKSLGGVLLLSNFLNCDDDGDGPPTGPEDNNGNGVIINNAPVTNNIETTFQEIGKVRYYFSGTDSDGSIDYINVSINNGSYEKLEEDYYTFPIIKGDNKVKAIAYDDKGKDGNLVQSSFYSPAEDEAKKLIEQYLIEKKSEYRSLKKDVLVSIGEDKSFYTDFWIVGDTGKDGYINYIGYNKNLEKELSNQNLLSNYYIPNLYLIRIPEDKIKRQIDIFLRGFK